MQSQSILNKCGPNKSAMHTYHAFTQLRIELSRRRESLPSKADGDSNDGEDTGWDEFEVQEVWVLVLSLWRRYKRWLMLLVSHCPELNHEVMAERSRRCVSFLPFHSIYH